MRQTLFLLPHKIVQLKHFPTSSCSCQSTHAHAASESVHFVNDEQRLIVWTIVVWSGARPVKSWRGVVGKKCRDACVSEVKVNPAGGAPCAREIAVTTSALVWWRLKDIFVGTPSGGQPSGGAPPARQRRMPELAHEIQRKEAEDEEMEGEVVHAGSDWRRAHEALCTTRVAREPWTSESVQLHRFSAKGKRNHSKHASSRPAVTKWPSKCGARTWEALLRQELLALSLEQESWIRFSCVFSVSSCH